MVPVGAGMGATQLEWSVVSPARAAGRPPINTVADPLRIMPGPAGMHPGSVQICVISVIRAAIMPPMRTLGCPFMMLSIIGGWGTGVGVGAGGCMGA